MSARARRRTLSTLAFRKMEGAGNDFVVLDARTGATPTWTRARIAALLDRRRGIGGDGLLRIEASPGRGTTRVRYWNADGSPAEYCGNGARCIGRLLLEEASAETVDFQLGALRVRARRAGTGLARIAVLHPRPTRLALPRPAPPRPRGAACAWVRAGVPHWILEVDDLEGFDLEHWGARIRSHGSVGRAGTNVNAVRIDDGVVRVRTWERGVEGETQACGSGLLAVGFWAVIERGVTEPVALRNPRGDRFRVESERGERSQGRSRGNGGAQGGGLWLTGPAREVYRGELDLEAFGWSRPARKKAST